MRRTMPSKGDAALSQDHCAGRLVLDAVNRYAKPIVPTTVPEIVRAGDRIRLRAADRRSPGALKKAAVFL